MSSQTHVKLLLLLPSPMPPQQTAHTLSNISSNPMSAVHDTLFEQSRLPQPCLHQPSLHSRITASNCRASDILRSLCRRRSHGMNSTAYDFDASCFAVHYSLPRATYWIGQHGAVRLMRAVTVSRVYARKSRNFLNGRNVKHQTINGTACSTMTTDVH
jgi:hypothetical protein